MKDPEEYTIDEVCIWLNCIGLGTKVDPFRENAVDGNMLVTLTTEDLTGDLGLSNLQAKKVVASIESTKEITASGGGGDSGAWEATVDSLTKENADLKAQLAALKPPPVAAPAPAPVAATAPAKPAPPPKHKHEVARGAAGGAAVGATKGAIVGAIVPGMDAKDGAKAGAAVGGLSGGLRGARRRVG
jgi:hypothetical protein